MKKPSPTGDLPTRRLSSEDTSFRPKLGKTSHRERVAELDKSTK